MLTLACTYISLSYTTFMQLIKITATLLSLITMSAFAADSYSPVGNHIKTQWAETVTPENAWRTTYPRPSMKRAEWKNLNGLWDYAITPSDASTPEKWDGKILVPYPVESSLSGVGRTVGADSALWYSTTFDIPRQWKKKDVLLNFGAVDWRCQVWVNGVEAGSHEGGYSPFSLDITKMLKPKGDNKITVRVYDPSNKGHQPRGKQVAKPKSIWYTPVTGIWQTVWLEPVDKDHIKLLRLTPDLDNKKFRLNAQASSPSNKIKVEIIDNGKVIASATGRPDNEIIIDMPDDVKPWSPSDPFRYDMKVSLMDGGKTRDAVMGKAAMRKISSARDDKGVMRMQLNGRDLFQFGPLDQGWWPDGLYTAPSKEALLYDVDKTRDLGFNMIRKHVKVEPEVWYDYCDSIGMLVWQDMPSGDKGPGWDNHHYFKGIEKERTAESEACFRREWKEIMDYLHNHPSIVVWVPFNESWGQFKTVEISDWTKAYDPSRLVNPASGGNFFHTGDILDLHNYPAPEMYLYDPDRVNVIGEYGGIGLAIEDHLWKPDRNWGYVKFKNENEVTDEYVKYARILLDLIPKGFSAGVYTQTTDVEIEVNGLMTYDRKRLKVDPTRIKAVNDSLTSSLDRP